MQAVQVVSRGKVAFVDAPVPELRAGHALVRPLRTSLCGSDIWMIDYSDDAHFPFEPGTSAHEMVGVIDAVEAPASGIKAGDVALVFAPNHKAMAEYFLAPVDHILPLPLRDGELAAPMEHLLQAQQLGTVFYACQNLPNVISKTVVVVGQGSAGLWFNTVLSRLGARKVIAVDVQGHRLAVSKHYGATHTIHSVDMDNQAVMDAVQELNDGLLADVVVEAAGEQSSINLALSLARHSGFVLCFGLPRPSNTMEIDYGKIFFDNLHVKACVGAMREQDHASTRMALELIGNGTVDVAPMLTHSFPFSEAADAYELHRMRDEGAIKIVVEMPGG